MNTFHLAKLEHAIDKQIWWEYLDGLVEDCSNSIAYALELLQSCTKPLILYANKLFIMTFPETVYVYHYSKIHFAGWLFQHDDI